MAAVAPKVVRLIFEVRDNESCFYCRKGLRWHERGIGWSLHHRRPRGAGGTSLAWVNQPPNAIVLCGSGTTGCHGWVESHRELATEYGLLVSMHGQDLPVHIPVRREDGTWWWLTQWGSAVETDQAVPF